MSNEVYAKALVECGYNDATGYSLLRGDYCLTHGKFGSDIAYGGDVDPFADTLEGRRQADAIEDWLHENHTSQWAHSSAITRYDATTMHQHRLDRIKWCCERIEL